MIHNLWMQHEASSALSYSILFFMRNDHIYLEQCQNKKKIIFSQFFVTTSSKEKEHRTKSEESAICQKKSQRTRVAKVCSNWNTFYLYIFFFYSFFKILTSNFIWDFMHANRVSCKYKLSIIDRYFNASYWFVYKNILFFIHLYVYVCVYKIKIFSIELFYTFFAIPKYSSFIRYIERILRERIHSLFYYNTTL